jgi:hypothetical protein
MRRVQDVLRLGCSGSLQALQEFGVRCSRLDAIACANVDDYIGKGGDDANHVAKLTARQIDDK